MISNIKDIIKLKFKYIISFVVIFLYISFSIVLFFIYNNIFFENIEKKFKEQNEYASKVAYDLLKKEEDGILSKAYQIADNRFLFHVIKEGLLITTFDLSNNTIKTFPVNKVRLMSIASEEKMKCFRNGSRTDGSGIEIFDVRKKLVAYSTDFSSKYLDNGKEKFMNAMDFSSKTHDIAIFDKKLDKFFLKGIVPIGSYTNYETDIPGFIIVLKEISNGIVDDIKKILNKEVFVIENNKIIYSTLFKESNRIENEQLNIISKHDNTNGYYVESAINGQKMGINLVPVRDFENNIIFYIGTGYNHDEVKELYKKSIGNAIIFQILFSLILLLAIIGILKILFRPFDKVLESIKEIMNGNYYHKVKVKSYGEIKLLTESINTLSDTIESRERQLKELNLELENKVDDRTKELSEVIEKLKATQQQLVIAEKMVSLGKMAGGIAHEINSPLGAIYTGIQLLKDDREYIVEDKKSEYKESLLLIEDSVKRIKDIISKLMVYTSLNRKYEVLDIGELVKSAVGLMEQNMGDIKIDMYLEGGNNIRCDKSGIYYVVTALINNSKDAVNLKKQNGYKKKIGVSTYSKGNKVYIKIEDNGIGISEEDRLKIFDPFFTTKEVGRGMGLSLSVCYEILRQHNATIVVESEIGKGTEFEIEFNINIEN